MLSHWSYAKTLVLILTPMKSFDIKQKHGFTCVKNALEQEQNLGSRLEERSKSC